MLEYGYSIYSQFGEDGIIQHLIKELKLTNRQCCEFGMSGIIYSNTYNLVENYNWDGIFIEKDKEKTLDIKYGKVIVREVEVDGENSLENILKETHFENNFDILSIDIDGNDYHIWNSLENYNPNLIIIEFNPFIEPNIDYIYDGSKFSSSFKSMIELGIKKGYTLLTMSGNLLFGRNEKLKGTKLQNLLNENPYNLFLDDAMMVNERQIGFRRFISQSYII